MRQAMQNCVLVVEDEPAAADPVVSEVCRAERTLVLRPGRAGKVAAELMREGTKVVIARVPKGFAELLRVIDLVRASGQETSIIAVNEDHDDRVETALRTAGVTCYATDSAELEEALRQVGDETVLGRMNTATSGSGFRRGSL